MLQGRLLVSSASAGFFLSCCLLALSLAGSSTTDQIDPFVFSASLLGLISSYLVIVRRRAQLSLALMLALALLTKLIFLVTPVVLTTDISRYLFEGSLTRSLISPYLVSAANYTGGPHQLLAANVEHGHLSAIYPPLAQFFLAVFAHTAESWKFAVLIADLLGIYLLGLLLKTKDVPLSNLTIYALNPLCLLEISGSAHLEVFVVLFAVAALLLYERQSKLLTQSVAITAAVLIKYIPLFYLGVLCAHLVQAGQRKTALKLWGLSLAATAMVLIPLVSFGLFDSLRVYAQHWRFNDSLFAIIGTLFQADFSDYNSFKAVKLWLLGFWAAFSLVLLIRSKDLYLKLTWIPAGFLLCSAVYHPWYGLWFLPFLAVRPSRPLIILSVVTLLSYIPLLDSPIPAEIMQVFIHALFTCSIFLAPKVEGSRKWLSIAPADPLM